MCEIKPDPLSPSLADTEGEHSRQLSDEETFDRISHVQRATTTPYPVQVLLAFAKHQDSALLPVGQHARVHTSSLSDERTAAGACDLQTLA